MTKPLRFDARLAFFPRVGGGVAAEALTAYRENGRSVVEDIRDRAETDLGFWALPDDETLAARCTTAAEKLRGRGRTMVVLGIGGSSLGGRTVVEALRPQVPGQTPSVIFLDNVDPEGFHRVTSSLDLKQTVFNVVSKSGGTVETAAQFCLLRDRLKRELGEDGYRERMFATTDPSQGLMRSIADADGLETMNVPGNVGGRFSVFTAVGLLPAAFAGVDVKGLLAGAAAIRERSSRASLDENPALLNAALHVVAMRSGCPIHVMMPYADRLKPFAEWYGQLWAESLGKAVDRTGAQVHVGPTPVAALGSTDQHSQVQLFAEGPLDKLVTFVSVKTQEEPLAFPEDVPEGYAYLRGHTMAGLLDAERRGTALALARAGRPSVHIELDELNAHSLGQLLFLYQAQTAFAGEMLNVNAFDQPGVEMGKKIAFALMKREGFEDALSGMNDLDKEDPTQVLDS